ncbi:MAG: peptidoglycan-binding protein [Actinomycetota bacterium]
MTSSSGGSDVDETLSGAAPAGGTSSALDIIEPDEAAPGADATAPPHRRSRMLPIALALAVLAVAIVVAVGLSLTGGDEEARPPSLDPAVITESVVVRVLTSSVEAIGTVADRPAIVVPGPVSGPPAIVTATPLDTGSTVVEGAVVIELDGRPVVALEGPNPSYRDLRPGDDGPDVAAAQAALSRLGLLDGEPTGVFDTATQTAVVALYESLGYEALGPTPDDLAAIEAAQASVDEARRVLNDAEVRLSEAGEDLPRATILQLDADVAAAQAALADARADRDAELAAPTAARAEAERVRDELKATVSELEKRIDAVTALLEDGVDSDGDSLDSDGRDDLLRELTELEDELAVQRPRLDVAEVVLVDADADLQTVRRRTDEVVRAAEARLGAAQAARSAANASADTAAQRQAVDDAEAVLDRAEADLLVLEAGLGLRWPREERLVVDGLPRELSAVADLGSTVDTEAARLSTGRVDAVIAVPQVDTELVEPAQSATISGPGYESEAAVTDVADEPDADGRIAVTVSSLEAVPGAAEGDRVRVAIPVAQTRGEVPVVPVAALSQGLGGTTQITVIDADGLTRLVRVVTGLTDDGFVTVDPVDDELSATDRVVVGIDTSGAIDEGRP